jgi:excisionase family DNA binding protein
MNSTLTVKQFAGKWGCSSSTVLRMLKDGTISGKRAKGRTWAIPKTEYKRLLDKEEWERYLWWYRGDERMAKLMMDIMHLSDDERAKIQEYLGKLIRAVEAGMDVEKYNALEKKFSGYMSTDEMIKRCMPKNVRLFPYREGVSK